MDRNRRPGAGWLSVAGPLLVAGERRVEGNNQPAPHHEAIGWGGGGAAKEETEGGAAAAGEGEEEGQGEGRGPGGVESGWSGRPLPNT